jgi:hypothetical protein
LRFIPHRQLISVSLEVSLPGRKVPANRKRQKAVRVKKRQKQTAIKREPGSNPTIGVFYGGKPFKELGFGK